MCVRTMLREARELATSDNNDNNDSNETAAPMTCATVGGAQCSNCRARYADIGGSDDVEDDDRSSVGGSGNAVPIINSRDINVTCWWTRIRKEWADKKASFSGCLVQLGDRRNALDEIMKTINENVKAPAEREWLALQRSHEWLLDPHSRLLESTIETAARRLRARGHGAGLQISRLRCSLVETTAAVTALELSAPPPATTPDCGSVRSRNDRKSADRDKDSDEIEDDNETEPQRQGENTPDCGGGATTDHSTNNRAATGAKVSRGGRPQPAGGPRADVRGTAAAAAASAKAAGHSMGAADCRKSDNVASASAAAAAASFAPRAPLKTGEWRFHPAPPCADVCEAMRRLPFNVRWEVERRALESGGLPSSLRELEELAAKWRILDDDSDGGGEGDYTAEVRPHVWSRTSPASQHPDAPPFELVLNDAPRRTPHTAGSRAIPRRGRRRHHEHGARRFLYITINENVDDASLRFLFPDAGARLLGRWYELYTAEPHHDDPGPRLVLFSRHSTEGGNERPRSVSNGTGGAVIKAPVAATCATDASNSRRVKRETAHDARDAHLALAFQPDQKMRVSKFNKRFKIEASDVLEKIVLKPEAIAYTNASTPYAEVRSPEGVDMADGQNEIALTTLDRLGALTAECGSSNRHARRPGDAFVGRIGASKALFVVAAARQNVRTGVRLSSSTVKFVERPVSKVHSSTTCEEDNLMYT